MLFRSGYLSQNENEFIIKGVKGLDFKIGTIADVGKIVICNGKYKLTKSFDVASKETQYPHNCNLEIYKNNEYLEAEIVWPMTELKASEEFAVNQYFEIEVL